MTTRNDFIRKTAVQLIVDPTVNSKPISEYVRDAVFIANSLEKNGVPFDSSPVEISFVPPKTMTAYLTPTDRVNYYIAGSTKDSDEDIEIQVPSNFWMRAAFGDKKP